MVRARLALVLIAVVALAAGLGAQQSPPPQSPAPPDEFLKGVVPLDTKGLVEPVIIRQVMPKYTPEAMRAKVQGVVKVQVVVAADGTVARARVLESLHPELDATAIAATKQYLFKPAQLKGETVPVAVELLLQFRLH
jgi:protein TonB